MPGICKVRIRTYISSERNISLFIESSKILASLCENLEDELLDTSLSHISSLTTTRGD